MRCQYTGLEFEARSARQKNHPQVSAFLNDAAKSKLPGAYAAAKDILAQAKDLGFETVEECMAFVNAQFGDWERGATEKVNQRNREEHERRRRARERARTNDLLRERGYRWLKITEEDMDAFGADAFSRAYGDDVDHVWKLVAPDGRTVTVAQALAEIAH